MKNDNVYIDDKFVGFEREDGKIAMQRCPKCDKENYCMCVLDGICAWCGHNVNKEQK